MTLAISSCDTALAVLQGMSDGMNSYANSYSNYNVSNQPSSNSIVNQTTTPPQEERIWQDCRVCNGSGRCTYCGGSGKCETTKNKRCGVCKGTGKCAACNGKRGYQKKI